MAIMGGSVVNLMIEMIGIMVSLFSILLLGFGFTHDRTTVRYFFVCFSSLLLYNLSILLLELMNGYQGVYGVPKRNADRPARGNYAAAGGNINRRKWEFMMRRQAVDRGWPRWYHESAFTHVQDRATLESDLSGI